MSWARFAIPKSPYTDPSDSLHRYPDPYQRKLRAAVAKLRGLEADQVFTEMAAMKRLTLSSGYFANRKTPHLMYSTHLWNV